MRQMYRVLYVVTYLNFESLQNDRYIWNKRFCIIYYVVTPLDYAVSVNSLDTVHSLSHSLDFDFNHMWSYVLIRGVRCSVCRHVFCMQVARHRRLAKPACKRTLPP